MEYDEEDNGAAGSIPEFGAIFMSSIVTKKECFKRKIFALPSSKAEFVKHVKAGMVLFLFEFEKRQLFGVYQASSDGSMDIVPYAFNYSGKHFPAQVCFTPLWHCNPLSEKEFRHAIEDNYFSAKKFNFGLSEDQVRRLLSLFSSRKLKNKLPPHLPTEVVVGAVGKDRGLVGGERFALSQRTYTEPNEYDECNPDVFCDYRGNSLTRAEEDELLIEDGVNTEDKVYPSAQGFLTDYCDDFLAKRSRVDDDERLIMHDLAENGMYNDYDTLRSWCIDPQKDSLEEARRYAGSHRLLTAERECNEIQVDKNLNPVLSSEYLMGPLDVRTAADDRFMQRNRLFSECDIGSGLGQAFAREHYGKPLDKSKHASGDDSFLFDNCVRREHKVLDSFKPVVYGDGNLNLLAQLTDDHQCLMNGKLKNKYHMDCDRSPVSGFEHSGSLLHKIGKTTAGRRFPVNDGMESEPNFSSCSVAGISSANFARPLQGGHRIIHDANPSLVAGRVSENMVDSIRCSAASKKNSGYITSVDGREVDDGRLRKSERVDDAQNIHEFVNPVISTEYPYIFKQKQNLSSFSDKYLAEVAPSQLTVAHNFDPSRLTFEDATITRAVPYIPELPNFAHGCSASLAADWNSSLVRENHPRFYSSDSRSSPYFLESKNSSRYLDMTPECGKKCLPTNASSHQSSLLQETCGSFPKSNLSMHMKLNNSAPVNYRGSLFSKPSLTSLPMAAQRMSEHVPPKEMDMLAGKDFICSEAKDFGAGFYHPERDLSSYHNQYFKISSNMNLQDNQEICEAPHFDSRVNRRSVFTRLTSGREVHVGEERNDTHFDCHDRYTDASADEVMEMLKQDNNLPLRKLRKVTVVGQPKHGESDLDEKLTQSHIKINHSTVEKKKLEDDLATAESIDELPKETRIVDFKRRSETKKNVVGTSIDSVAHGRTTVINEEVESSAKNLKRKKLVRPVFRKIELATDGIGSDQNSQLLGQILDKDHKQSCERAISIIEAKIPIENATLSNALVSRSHQSMEYNIKEHSNPEVQKDIEAHVLSSTSHELKGHKKSNVSLQTGSSQVLLEGTTDQSFGIQTTKGTLSRDIDATVSSSNLEESSSEGLKLGVNSGNDLREDKKLMMLKSKKKIIRTNKTGTECSQ